MPNKDYTKAKILLEQINQLRANFDQLYRSTAASGKYTVQGKWNQNFVSTGRKQSSQQSLNKRIQEMVKSKFQQLANHIRLIAEAIDKKILILTKSVSNINPSRNVSSSREASNYFEKNKSKHLVKQKSPQFGGYNWQNKGNTQFRSFDIAADQIRTQEFTNMKPQKATSMKSAVLNDIKTQKIVSQDKYDQFLKKLQMQLENKNQPSKYFDVTNKSHFENEKIEGFIQNQHNFPFDQYPYERPNRPKIFDQNKVSPPKINSSQKSIRVGVGNQIDQQLLSQKKQGQLKGAFKINKKKSTQSSLKNCDTIDKKHRYQFLVKSLIDP